MGWLGEEEQDGSRRERFSHCLVIHWKTPVIQQTVAVLAAEEARAAEGAAPGFDSSASHRDPVAEHMDQSVGPNMSPDAAHRDLVVGHRDRSAGLHRDLAGRRRGRSCSAGPELERLEMRNRSRDCQIGHCDLDRRWRQWMTMTSLTVSSF